MVIRDPKSAEARRSDGYVRLCERQLELLPDDIRLGRAPQAIQTLVVTMQCPDIIGVLVGAPGRWYETKVLGIRVGGLLDQALLQRQSRKCVACGKHPSPRFGKP